MLLLHRGTVTLLRCVIVAVCYFCTAVLLLCLIIVLLYCCTVAYSIAGIQYYCCFITVRWYRCTLTDSIIAVLLLCGGIVTRRQTVLLLCYYCAVVSLHADRQYYCCVITARWYRCTLTDSIIAVLLLRGGIVAR